jgi:DNA-binding response OmpR family regulator
MKLLLVLGSDDTYDLISVYLRPLGFDLIRYQHAVKAMDNIDEADPAGIIISAEDFPRHWKVLVQFVRAERSKDDCPIIVLKGGNFSMEETSKAFYLGVNGIVSEDLNNSVEIDRLQSILSRYVPVEEKRKTRRIPVQPWNRLGLLFSNPLHKSIIIGDIKTISNTGIAFRPEHPVLIKDIKADLELSGCSLRAGEAILSPVCKVVRTGRIISLEFISFPEGEQTVLEAYLEALPLEDLPNRQEAAG